MIKEEPRTTMMKTLTVDEAQRDFKGIVDEVCATNDVVLVQTADGRSVKLVPVPKFPVVCKTWDEVERIKAQYCTPTGKGPKGQLCYDLEEVARYVIFPKD
jgi:hypothetical protein